MSIRRFRRLARTAYQDCMSMRLKGKLAGKSKIERQRIFSQAAHECSRIKGSSFRESGSTSKQPSKQTKPKKSKVTTSMGGHMTYTVSTRKKPEKKPIRKTAKQKAMSKPVPVSGMEKRTEKLHQRIEQVRLALGVPKADVTLRITSKNVTIKMGFLKRIKRRKFSDAVRVLEQKARSRV